MIIKEVLPLNFFKVLAEGADIAVEQYSSKSGIYCHVITYSRDIALMVAEELGWDLLGRDKMGLYRMSSQIPAKETISILETLTSSLEARRGWKYAVIGTYAQRIDEEPVHIGFT